MNEKSLAEKLGPQLILARNSLGMRQVDVSKASGVAVTDISRYENGRVFPTMGNFVALCDALRLRPDAILLLIIDRLPKRRRSEAQPPGPQ